MTLLLKNFYFIILYLLIVLLSVLYSHDSFRFKSNGYVAVFFNWIIGTSTFLVPTLLGSNNFYTIAFGGFSSGFFLSSIYLMMQVHQHKEDRQRKDKSIMVIYGRTITLRLAIMSLMIAGISSFVALKAAQFSYQYILILILYFSLIILFNYIWLRKKGGSLSDFKIMNRLTLRISYGTNVLLMAIYVYEVILRSSR
jgi:4-hydroxybenzoate polyprenyltransferase